MRRILRTAAILALLAVPAASLSVAQPAGSATVACTTCHAEPEEWEAREHVHAPLAAGQCLACHNPHASRHGGLMRGSADRVCLECHEDLTGKARGDGTHEALAGERSCLSCHDPHASDHDALLVQDMPALCSRCHEQVPGPVPAGRAHLPAAEGQCLSCHDPHGSEHPALAVEAQPGLCAGCHETSGPEVSRAHKGIDVSSSDCSSCHAPHGSNLEKLVRLNTHAPFSEGSCGICHQDPAQPASELRSGAGDLCAACHEPHQAGHPVDAGDACVSCHTPHTSSGAALIAGSEAVVCTSCHDGIGTRLDAAADTHPELDRGQHCSVCHQLHTGETRFYLKSINPMATCTECHQTHSEFAHPMGRGVLDRSRRGRTVDCLSCHDPHGTAFPRLLLADPRRDLCILCHAGGTLGGGLGAGR